jgi:hypothetical protein
MRAPYNGARMQMQRRFLSRAGAVVHQCGEVWTSVCSWTARSVACLKRGEG